MLKAEVKVLVLTRSSFNFFEYSPKKTVPQQGISYISKD